MVLLIGNWYNKEIHFRLTSYLLCVLFWEGKQKLVSLSKDKSKNHGGAKAYGFETYHREQTGLRDESNSFQPESFCC